MSDERIVKDNYHLKVMASAIDILSRKRDMLKPNEVNFLDNLIGMQEIRSMPTLRQWNYMNSLKQTVMGL